MATRVCPECGSQYVASVRRCIDCDVVLVDQEGADGGSSSSTVAASSGDQMAYELEGWGNQLRQSLAGMLDLAEIPFVWEAGTLVVPASFEDEVDRCIAAVEGSDAEELDDDAELVAFEIEGITTEELEQLDGVLIAAGIAHSWSEDGELLVAEEHEAAVGALIEATLDSEEEGDGLALQEALTALFVAVDKLMKDPADAKLVARYGAAVDGLDGLGLPYGMAEQEWASFLTQVEDLRAAVESPAGQEDSEADTGAQVEDEDDAADEVEERADAEDEPDADADADADADGEDQADGEDEDGGDEPATDPASLARALRARLQELV